jgi:hypothetical protein
LTAGDRLHLESASAFLSFCAKHQGNRPSITWYKLEFTSRPPSETVTRDCPADLRIASSTDALRYGPRSDVVHQPAFMSRMTASDDGDESSRDPEPRKPLAAGGRRG